MGAFAMVLGKFVGGARKSLLPLIMAGLMVLAVGPSFADIPAPSNTGTFVQTEEVRAKVGDLTVAAPAADWRFGRLRGRIEVIESATAVGPTTYKVEATAVDLNGDVVQLRRRVIRLRAGQAARVGYGLPVSKFGREAELEVAVWRQDGESWVPVGTTSLTLRRRVRVRDTLVIGTPTVPPPSGFAGLILENRTSGLRFNSIAFGRSSESARYDVTFAPTQGEPVGPTTSVDPGENAKIAASSMAGAGFGAGTYSATIRWSDGSTSTVTWPAWSGQGAVSVTVNDSTPRAIP